MNPQLRRLTPFRFVAALFVVVFHFGRAVYPFNSSWAAPFVGNGYVSVSFFFCLSGFIMATVYRNPMTPFEKREFWLARFSRIYPVFILCLLLGAFSWPTSLAQAFMNVFLVQAWIPGNALSLNSPGWSLSVETLFYIAFPFIAGGLYLIRIRTAVVLALILWIVTQFLTYYMIRAHYHGFPSKSHDLIFYFPLMHLNEFVMGIVAGTAFHHRLPSVFRAAFMCVLAVCAVHGLEASAQAVGLVPNNSNGLYAPYFVAFIWVVASLPKIPLLEQQVAVTLGEASYALYLLQLPLMAPLTGYLKRSTHLSDDANFFVCLGVLTVSALMVYFWFERPMRSVIKRAGRRVLTASP
jgi:peptidoglycan/LPS O-acetylase OafA/YrhL